MALALEHQESLVQKAEQIEELVSLPASSREVRLDVAGTDVQALLERRMKWYRSLQDAVLDLSSVLPEGVDDYDARKLLEFLAALGRAIEDDPSAADEQGDVQLLTIKVHDVAMRIGRRLQHDALDNDPQRAFAFIANALPGVPAVQLGELLGVSAKTIGAWKAGGAIERQATRVVLVAQLLTYLRPTLTPTGIVLWFRAPRDQLSDATPLEAMNANLAASLEPLLALARGSRAQLAG